MHFFNWNYQQQQQKPNYCYWQQMREEMLFSKKRHQHHQISLSTTRFPYWFFRHQHCALATLLLVFMLLINLVYAADKQYHATDDEEYPMPPTTTARPSSAPPSIPPVTHIFGYSSGSTIDRRYELQILRRLLAAGYTYYARPLTTDNGTLEVRTRISLIKIQNLWERTDVKTEALEVTMRIQLNWCDGALSWEPDSFGGVDYVIIPGDRLWIPDIQIINALDDVYALIRDRRFDFKLHSDGCVWWFPTGTIFTRCELDLSYFPFDIQRCPIVFESAMYPKEFLNLTVRYDKSAVSLKTFTESGQWDLITAYAIPKLNYVTTSTAFSRVEITLEIRRKTLYYKINVFFPCGMLSALQILTFFLPIGSEDRISQSTTILLSVVVFQSIVVGELPRTSNSTPLLCLYIDFLTGISVITVADAILGVYVLNDTNRHGCLARMLQFTVLLGGPRSKNKTTKTDVAANKNHRPAELDDDMELLAHKNNNSLVQDNRFATMTPKRMASNAVIGATIVNEDATGGEDTFEEDSLDAFSRQGGETTTTNIDLLVVSLGQPGDNKSPSNHTLTVVNRSNNNNTANYGTASSTGSGHRPPLPRRSSSCNAGVTSNRKQDLLRDRPPSSSGGERKTLPKRILHPLFQPNNIHVKRRPGEPINDDDSVVSVGTNALRAAAVCIDNFVFFIALTSSILIPFYMFNVLPPTS